MPIRVDKANKIKIVAEPSSKSNQLIKGNDYTIKINIFTKEDRPIYPSEVYTIYTSLYQIISHIHIYYLGILNEYVLKQRFISFRTYFAKPLSQEIWR